MTSVICYNKDVLIEILLRLPAKSLIRFKSVCKHWLLLISSDQFCRLHTLRHLKPHPSLILRSAGHFYFHPILNPHKLIPYTFTNIPNPQILSSCNGLLLLGSDQNSYYVYNPTTKQSRKITLTFSDEHTFVLGLTLAFDPSVSSHYKIVCVATKQQPFDSGRCCQIEVYDSESRTWKLCLETVLRTMDFRSGVHWNNVIHWENSPGIHIYFDIIKNVIGYLSPLETLWRNDRATNFQLQESSGHLYSFFSTSRHGDNSIQVYELKDDHSRWLFKYYDATYQLPREFRILSFIRGDNGETCTLAIHVPGKIMAYRFLDRSYEELIDFTHQFPFYRDNDLMQFDCRNFHQFGESMAPV